MNIIRFPPSTQNIHDQLSSFIGQLKAHVSNQAEKLDELVIHTPSELAEDAVNLSGINDQITNLLFTGYGLAFTPYQYRIGNDGLLAADTALSFAAEKLTDSLDLVNGSYGLALVVTASDESTLASRLQAITKLLAFPEWLAAADHATKHAVLAIEKLQIPGERLNPYWHADDYALQQPLASTQVQLCAENATIEAIAESNISPTDRLKQLATQQNTRLTQLLADMTQLIALFSGSCSAIKLTGTPNQMAKTLKESSISSEPYSVLFLLVSSTKPTFFYEMVNV